VAGPGIKLGHLAVGLESAGDQVLAAVAGAQVIDHR
jgi:hypothetical protein